MLIKTRHALDNDLDKLISKQLRLDHERELASREPSGKLSASMLGKPLLEQCLKMIGVPRKSPTDYSLRLFARGRDVEAWLIKTLGVEKAELMVEYRQGIGYPDIIDTTDGSIPWEVKSIKNSTVKWLLKEGPNWAYRLQAAFYALALEAPVFKLICITSDDYRTFPFDFVTQDYAREVDTIITTLAVTLASGVLPEFTPYLSYQGKPEYADTYSDYPDWVHLDQSMLMAKLEREYPQCLAKLQEFYRVGQ